MVSLYYSQWSLNSKIKIIHEKNIVCPESSLSYMHITLGNHRLQKTSLIRLCAPYATWVGKIY